MLAPAVITKTVFSLNDAIAVIFSITVDKNRLIKCEDECYDTLDQYHCTVF